MKWTDQIFHSSLAAGFYDVLTRQVFWRDAIAGMLEYVEHVPQHARVLDLGCGPGISTFALGTRIPRPAELTGLDLSQEMIEIARETYSKDWSHLKHLKFEQGDASKLPYSDESFDLVFGHSFLYLVDDPIAVLREVKRVLKPHGQVVFMEPNGSGSLIQAARESIPNAPKWLPMPWSAARFGLSMAMWRIASGGIGQMTEDKLAILFNEAGFIEHSSTATLGSLGLHTTGKTTRA